MAIKTIKATIQMRHGLEEDFDADQMTTGEWSVSEDTKYVRMCFSPGLCIRMATYEAFEQDMLEIQTILATCQDIQVAVDAMANLAEQHSKDALDYFNLSKSYAVGTDGEIREEDDTDNARYYYRQSKKIYDNFNSAGDVTGVKGNAEAIYRIGQVNLTPENLGALSYDGDSKNNTVSFADEDEETANSWTDVSVLESGEKHGSIFGKISTMFKNVRYLYKMLGNTDISSIGSGTVTGAISALNNNLVTETGNISMGTSSLTYYIRSYFYNKVTREVTILILCDGNRSINDPIAVLSERMCPNSAQLGLCWVTFEEDNTLHAAYSRIDTDGKIYQRVTDANIKRCLIYIKYVI